METRQCGRCKALLLRASFNVDPQNKDGLKNYCRDCQKAYQDQWKNKDRTEWRKRQCGYAKQHQTTEHYKQKDKVRKEMRAAVKSGLLKKPTNCQVCGMDGRIEGHHSDYGKPLQVEWLCVQCHRLAHRKLGYPFIEREAREQAAA